MTDLMKNEIITGLLDIFSDNILTIILYGSVARNENTPESDIDIAIVIKNNKICITNFESPIKVGIVTTGNFILVTKYL